MNNFPISTVGGWGIVQRCPIVWGSGASLRSAASHPKCESYSSAAPNVVQTEDAASFSITVWTLPT